MHGVAEQQGFARTHLWVIEENPPAFPTKTAIKSFVDLILKPSEEELKNWPHRFYSSYFLSYCYSKGQLAFIIFFACCPVL